MLQVPGLKNDRQYDKGFVKKESTFRDKGKQFLGSFFFLRKIIFW